MSIIAFKDIALGVKLGAGTYGTVYKGTYRGKIAAIKNIIGTPEQAEIQREIDFLTKVKHINIIELYGISLNDEHTYLIMEYLDGGSLHQFLHSNPEIDYKNVDALNWLCQAAEGLAYLHQFGNRPIIHRDVKPLNMLLNKSRDVLKLCDFGTVRELKTLMTSQLGTCLYMAPEVFKGTKYNEKCDVYSLGITQWQVISRKRPYYNTNLDPLSLLKEVDVNGMRPEMHEIPDSYPKQIQTLMTQCWDANPNNRPTMSDVVKMLKVVQAKIK